MSEYGQAVAHGAGQAPAPAGGGNTDVGTAIAAGFTNALNQASATTGIPSSVLLVLVVAVLLFAAWFVFAR